MLESLFNKVSGFQIRNFIKKRLQHRRSPVKIAEFFKNTLFYWTPPVAASNKWSPIFSKVIRYIFYLKNWTMKFKWTKDFATILRNPYTRKVFRWTHIFAECFQWLFIKKMKTISEIHENEIHSAAISDNTSFRWEVLKHKLKQCWHEWQTNWLLVYYWFSENVKNIKLI